ncbi:MAG: response regulator [Pseudomonadales bacterium]|nr:response regulator [Pseudomonadales bacterium]
MSMEKVLVVEDSRSFSLMLKVAITQGSDFSCVVAESYAEAKSVLEAQGDDFFCAVVDLNLPDAPNGEAVDLVAGYKIATIVFTGQISDSLREDFLQKKVADYVLKSGQHNIDYVVAMIKRLYANATTKVLVVDDSALARKQVSRLLAIQRFVVIEASSGEDALNMLELHPDVRIALIDGVMDQMDGYQLTSKIRAQHTKEELVIIGVSGQSGQATSAKFIKSGANDFIAKPFLAEELNCRVNQNADFIDQFYQLKKVSEQRNQILGMAAHDMRGPLGVVQGLANLLLKKERPPEKQKKYFEMILSTSSQMLNLLNDLLDMSTVESGQMTLDREPVKLSALVHERVDFNRSVSEKKDIELVESLPDTAEVMLDTSRIRQVIDNLLSNAIKYSPLKSQVDVCLSETEKFIRLEVRDHGPGIKEGDRDKLFGAFQRLGNKTTGGESSNGLGLAICKNMVDAHSGNIGYQSNEEGGSCFYFELPKKVEAI